LANGDLVIRFLTFAIVLGAALPAIADERIKMPPPVDIEKASKLVRELFKEEYAKPQQAAKAALAGKLFDQVAETTDDAAAQFVLLRESAELAAAGNDYELAVRSCRAMRARFAGSFADVLEPVIKSVVAKSTTADANQTLTAYLLQLIDDTLAADDLDGAMRQHKMAEGTAIKSKNVRTVSLVATRGRELAEFQKELGKVAAALKTLRADPDDGEACLTAGKYYCFQRGDWERGLTLLSKCTDAKLRDAARKDLAEPTEPSEIAQVADGWYEVLGALSGYSRRALQARAYALYGKALPSLGGLSRTKAERRMAELERAIEARSDYPGLWTLVRTAIRNKSYETHRPMGGAFGDKDYSEVLPDCGVLIGFNYTLKPIFDKELIDCFQPIYLTAAGEKLGAAYGNFKAAKKLTVKAKAGYAIGRMAIRGGGLLGGVNVVFMRMNGPNLNPNDTYETGWIGHKDQPNAPFLGDGRPIIGIHGKLQNEAEGGGICSIGLYVVGDKSKGKPKK
jgi:hypothetical protein